VARRLPSMPRITVSDAQLAQWVAAATENIEVLQGARGGGIAPVADNGALVKDLETLRHDLGFQQKSLERLSRTVANIGNTAKAQETASPAQQVLAQLRQNQPQKPQTVVVGGGGSGGVTIAEVNAAIDQKLTTVNNNINNLTNQINQTNNSINNLQNQTNQISASMAALQSQVNQHSSDLYFIWQWIDNDENNSWYEWVEDEIMNLQESVWGNTYPPP